MNFNMKFVSKGRIYIPTTYSKAAGINCFIKIGKRVTSSTISGVISYLILGVRLYKITLNINFKRDSRYQV